MLNNVGRKRANTNVSCETLLANGYSFRNMLQSSSTHAVTRGSHRGGGEQPVIVLAQL